MKELMSQHLSGKTIITVVLAGETVSIAPQKGDEGEEGVTSEGRVTKRLLFYFHTLRPFSHGHLCFPLCLFSMTPVLSPSPVRVWQVPGGESQSCRGDARHAVAPQWWAGCGAGNPEAQEGGEAGWVAAGHVGLQDASVTCAASLRTNWRDPITSSTFLKHHNTIYFHTAEIYTQSPL